jgi:leucyl aminopeptidase
MARPRKPSSDRRIRKLVIWVNEIEHARYLINASRAALTPTDFARHRLCFESEAENVASDTVTHNPQLTFEYVDALNRVGTGMARLIRLAERSEGGTPAELQGLMARLDTLLHRELPS